jgi:ASC-1-like (ASCH) protein
MDHLAIMKKSWGLLPKILSGEKTIESRWYKNKIAPWDKIKKGEAIYFKDSGSPVTASAEVSKVLHISDINPSKVKKILVKYGSRDGIADIKKYYQLFKNKNYCLLIFLKNQKRIKPFNVNKKGFGMMSAWISVENINKIKSV